MHRSVRHAVPRTVPLRVDGAHGGESAFLSDEHSTACRLDLCAGLSIPVEVFMHYVCSKDEAKVLMLLHTRARALDEAERLRTEELENGVAIRAAMVECARAVHRTSVARGEGAGLYGRCAIDLKLGTLAGTEIVCGWHRESKKQRAPMAKIEFSRSRGPSTLMARTFRSF